MRHTAAGLGELFDFVVIDMDSMRKPDVVTQPAVRLHPIHRAKLETLERVPFLVARLAEVGVEFDLVLAGERGRVAQQRDGDRKRRTWREGDLRHGTGGRVVISLDDPLAVPEDEGLVLYAIIRRKPALGLAEGHRAAAGVEAHTEILRRLDLAIHVVPVFKNISMVEDRRATGERELRQPDERAGARGLLRRSRPDPILGLQPGEKVVVLRGDKIARKGLIEVMVGIDETRQDDLPGKVDHCVGRGRKFFVRANVFDETVLGVKPGVFQFPALAVHCDQDFGILGEECGHMI